MGLIEKVIEFVTKKLSIEITEENQKLILDEFYPDIEDKNLLVLSKLSFI
jgi:hypothetical protein